MLWHIKKIKSAVQNRLPNHRSDKKQAAEIGRKTLIYVFRPPSQLHTCLQEGHCNSMFRWLMLGQKEGLHAFAAELDTSHICLVNL